MDKKYIRILPVIFIALSVINSHAFDTSSLANFFKSPKAIWVTVFSKEKILYSKTGVEGLLDFCQKSKINEIYLQFYRGGEAFYDSKILDKNRYQDMLKAAGADMIDYLLDEANDKNIKVFAWICVLNIGQNRSADILKKYGNIVLTKDQHSRTSMNMGNPSQLDKYYMRDVQLYLEPGDPKVVDYTLAVTNDIMDRYPKISGFHLDYIRYPMAIPYLPDSRFNRFGISYGFGENNVARFLGKTGIDPKNFSGDGNGEAAWDDWKREQVTNLVDKISKTVKKKLPGALISCAVIPSVESAYLFGYQNWAGWLEKGIIDYVVLMNYTKDNEIAKQRVTSALAHRGKGKVYNGIGVFVMEKIPDVFIQQYDMVKSVKPDGIAFFAYDGVLASDKIKSKIIED